VATQLRNLLFVRLEVEDGKLVPQEPDGRLKKHALRCGAITDWEQCIVHDTRSLKTVASGNLFGDEQSWNGGSPTTTRSSGKPLMEEEVDASNRNLTTISKIERLRYGGMG